MNSHKDKLVPSPWPPVEEDLETGFPNLFALLSSLRQGDAILKGPALGLELSETGDRAVMALSRSILKAVSAGRWPRARHYRLAGDFYVFFPGGSVEDVRGFVSFLRSDSSCPAVTHTIAAPGDDADPLDMLLDLWARLLPGSSRGNAGNDSSINIARHLLTKIEAIVDLLQEARRLAYTDDISGLPNHRAASYIIENHLSSIRADYPLSLLFVDGDNLRQYNEEMGYEAGNEMIRRLGATISCATAPGETVTRWLSGDEFMIILPGVDKAGAIEKANRICAEVKDKSAGWEFPVTVSIGIVTSPEDGVDTKLLLAAVEKANSNAKKLGKNRVCTAGEPVA